MVVAALYGRQEVDTVNDKHLEPDIYVVGAGVRVPGHLTLEALDILGRCREIYTILPQPLHKWLPGELVPQLRSVWPLYESGGLRREIYDREVATVLDAAERGRPIAYLALGNPIVFDSVTQGVINEGTERGLDVCVIPGISSIDTILVDLNYEVASGLQIFDASSLVGLGIEPRVDAACLLLQLGAFGTDYTTVGYEMQPGALTPLRDHLLCFYPAEHEVVFVTSAMKWEVKAKVDYMPLRDLDRADELEVRGSSLFVPRLRLPEPDPAFFARMSDPASLHEAYRPESGSQ